VGSITPDPSGISQVLLRFTKDAGTKKVVVKKPAKKKKSTKKKKKKKKRSASSAKKKKKKKKKPKPKTTLVHMCATLVPNQNYLATKPCSQVKFIAIQAADATVFRYELPLALGTGAYTVEVVATDGAGNTDVLVPGRNQMRFKVIPTASNSGTDTGPPTDTGTAPPPINDTGSPFG
jgi:hypothetical protein